MAASEGRTLSDAADIDARLLVQSMLQLPSPLQTVRLGGKTEAEGLLMPLLRCHLRARALNFA